MGRIKTSPILTTILNIYNLISDRKVWHLGFIGCLMLGNFCSGSFMDISEIKPGMHGIGKTVFTQAKIEDFGVEIIDVMRNVSPRGDVILARLSGGSFPGGLEKSGVIAGMSGSPVYIDGKLIGAIAYTWSFLKEPIAGITPIKEMLDIIEIDKQSQALPKNEDFQFTGQNTPAHIPIPVTFSSPAISTNLEFSNQIKKLFSDYGFLPVFTAGGAADNKEFELVPGSAVGVSLIQGDMYAAGIGTLTYRDKDKILAFGHPMFLGGKVDLPMVGGIIHSIMPSTALSFKIFSPTKPLGIVSQDRANGIMAEIGKTSKMIPVKVGIHSTGIDTVYSYKSIDHKFLFPGLLQSMILNSIVAEEGIFSESTIKADMTLVLKSGTDQTQTIKFSQKTSGDASAAIITSNLTEPVALLLENNFQKIKLETIEINLAIENKKKISYIEKLITDLEKVKPGDSVELTIILRSFQGNPYQKKIDIAIPKETQPGSLALLVANADSTYLLELSRTPGFVPKSFTQLVENLQKLGNTSEIQISGYSSQRGMVIQAQEFPNPPQFLKQVVTRSKNPPSFTETSRILRYSLTTEDVITGMASINLIIEK